MNEMFSSILNLLQTNTCVVVPMLGGFVANRKSASIDATSGKFCPPSLQVVYNPKLNHNDGLLSQEYARVHGLSINDAQAALNTFVSELKNNLTVSGLCKVDGFGTFRCVNDKISFSSEVNFSDWSDSIGLPTFYCPTLAEAVEQEKNVFSWKKMAGVGVAASLAICLLLPTMQNIGNNFASFNPFQTHSVILQDTAIAPNQPEKILDKFYSQQQVDEMSQLIADSVRAKVMSEIQPSRFHVILCQFDNTKDADDFVNKWQSRLSDKLTVEPIGNDMFGVSCAKTEDPKLALKMLNNVRSNSLFKQTFLFYK
ncbi:MAG: hypothetical protein KBT32_08150 [Bacteroidales bacterium]|nr:hypothetical protein [Candidatus Physcocola equi]